MRLGKFRTHAVEICCAHCGEPLPNPDNGGDGWYEYEARAAEGTEVRCNGCDKKSKVPALPKRIEVRP